MQMYCLRGANANLFPAIDYIQYLRQQKKKHEDELENLKKEAMALGIMKS